MRADSTALRGGKVCQINDDGVEPLLQQRLGNLPQKGLDVEPSRRARSHRIVDLPLPIKPIAGLCRITSQPQRLSAVGMSGNSTYDGLA